MVKKLMASMLAFGISFGGIGGTKSENFNYSLGLEKKIDDSFLETSESCYSNTLENALMLEGNLFPEEYEIKKVSEVDFTKVPTPKYIPKEKVKEIVDSLYRVMHVPKLISKDFFISSVQNESSFNIYAVSPVGARGLAQIMPETWRELNPSLNFYLEVFNPEKNLATGLQVYTKVYNFVRKHNPSWEDLSDAEKLEQLVAGYNWGIGKLKNYAEWDFSLSPLETKNHLKKVLKEMV